MASYMTGQRRELLGFLRTNHDRAFSAKEIAEEMSDRGVSQSAVYRNLAWLEKNGKISRSTRDGHREIYYSFVDAEECRRSLHLTCEKCGRTVHMDPAATGRMLSDIAGRDGFSVNMKKTVLYGVCAKCKG
ncbi:MAG: transcriptional repressor [Clostridia bacterium]|nr:transcriptional repressor [Clostridia bacterium]